MPSRRAWPWLHDRPTEQKRCSKQECVLQIVPTWRDEGEIISCGNMPAEERHSSGKPAESRMCHKAAEAFQKPPGEKRPQHVAGRPSRQTAKQRILRRTEQY